MATSKTTIVSIENIRDLHQQIMQSIQAQSQRKQQKNKQEMKRRLACIEARRKKSHLRASHIEIQNLNKLYLKFYEWVKLMKKQNQNIVENNQQKNNDNNNSQVVKSSSVTVTATNVNGNHDKTALESLQNQNTNLWQEIVNSGLQIVPQWIQCSLTSCRKWRVLEVSTSQIVQWIELEPKNWTCSKNKPPNNNC